MAQPAPPRRSVGPIAVQLGLISREQLEAAQAAQAASPGKSLDQILVDQKALTQEQIRSILQETSRHTAPPPAPGAKPGPPRAARPQAKPAHGTRRTVVSSPGNSSKTWIMAGALGLIPVLGLLGYLLFRSGPAEAPNPEIVEVKPEKEKPKDIARVPVKPEPVKPATPEPKTDTFRIKATLRRIPGHSPIATRWNAAADKINSMRDPEQYKPVLEELEGLIKDARGTEHFEDVKDGYKDVLQAIQKRGEQIYGFLADEVARLGAAGKFGDAIKSWEWFPGHLDLVGSYQKKIEEHQKKTLAEARTYFEKLKAEVETLVNSDRLDDAHLLLLRGLEIGIDEFVDDAQKRMVALTLKRDIAIKNAEEERLAAFEREKAAEKEASKISALYQAQFWDLVSRRNLTGAKAFLSKQAVGAAPEVAASLKSMDKALDEIRGGFDLVARQLATQAGRTVSLAFLENGDLKIRSFLMKSVQDGKIVYTVEGRDLTVPLTDLHSSEIAKLAASGPKEDKDFLEGMARLLDGGFDDAHTSLSAAGARAGGLVAFVETSSAFLARNAPVMKNRIERLLKDKMWERAIQEYTKLASVPAERKGALQGRARAYYQVNNFMGTASDIEALFDEFDDFSEPTLDLLNQSYQRSALIDKGIRMYEKANARRPDNVAVLTNLVELYMKIHEFQKAKEALSRAEKLKGGGGGRLASLAHLVSVALEPAFPGRTFKAQFGRYDLETNVSQEYATKMARFMDKVYASYIKVFPYKKNETLRFHLKLFATEGEFFTYYKRSTGADPSGPKGKILAYYMPVTKELVGWNADGIEETLQHEGLHQYFDYFISDCPIWFNEGYASYFETSTAEEVRFNPERHNTAKWLFMRKELPSLKQIFMMTGDVFRAQGAYHYGSSWSVIYWFVKSGRKQLLDRYFEALMEGKDQQQAFDSLFGPGKENVDELDALWQRAIREENYDK